MAVTKAASPGGCTGEAAPARADSPPGNQGLAPCLTRQGISWPAYLKYYDRPGSIPPTGSLIIDRRGWFLKKRGFPIILLARRDWESCPVRPSPAIASFNAFWGKDTCLVSTDHTNNHTARLNDFI
ncbi:MAG: hypothetical protein BWY93_01718 [Euryarchaeota archaeon ADurb.BinA087]|nr:MAG: hypothetical protein BWY93_01718 [Euryarchaeota archaeon ADurb.BinA087]HPX72913.1 hypothetical protein [Methanoregulaceae archaeon]HQA80719.1 hypothetical protein [Methanoregulaceae archaeon]